MSFVDPKISTAYRPFGEYGYSWILANGPHLVVDLGVQYGYSTICFAQGVRDAGIGSVVGVDHFRGDPHAGMVPMREEFNRNLAGFPGLAPYIQILESDIGEGARCFADASIDLLSIDAFHEYDAVAADFSAYWSKLRPGATVFLHDYVAFAGVRRFVDELASGRSAAGNQVEVTGIIKSEAGLAIARKARA